MCATRKLERFWRAYTDELAAFLSVVSDDLENPCTAMDTFEAFYIAGRCELSRTERRPLSVADVRR